MQFWKKVKTFHQYQVSNVFLWYLKIHGPILVSKVKSLWTQHLRCMFSHTREATFPYNFVGNEIDQEGLRNNIA